MAGISIESFKGRRIIGRLEMGEELHAGLLEAARKHGVLAGTVTAIGAVSRLEVSEYEQSAGRYAEPIVRQGDAEILNLGGNFSYKDGELFLHAHILTSYITPQGRDAGAVSILGGHLVSAAVFACEYIIEALDDVELTRGLHEPTGLQLWVEAAKKE